MNLQDIYIALAILFGGGGLAGLVRGLWRTAGAVHQLLSALAENTEVTAKLAGDLVKWRKSSRRADREFDRRITRLEEAHRGQSKPAADPRPAHRDPRRPGPDRRRRMGPV